jgi:hypothetical protein
MKSIIPLSAITVLAALALVGCNQSSPSNSPETPPHDSRMSDTNSVMRGSTNMPPNSHTTGAANDATR